MSGSIRELVMFEAEKTGYSLRTTEDGRVQAVASEGWQFVTVGVPTVVESPVITAHSWGALYECLDNAMYVPCPKEVHNAGP